jgi:hypothetical protein
LPLIVARTGSPLVTELTGKAPLALDGRETCAPSPFEGRPGIYTDPVRVFMCAAFDHHLFVYDCGLVEPDGGEGPAVTVVPALAGVVLEPHLRVVHEFVGPPG